MDYFEANALFSVKRISRNQPKLNIPTQMRKRVFFFLAEVKVVNVKRFQACDFMI